VPAHALHCSSTTSSSSSSSRWTGSRRSPTSSPSSSSSASLQGSARWRQHRQRHPLASWVASAVPFAGALQAAPEPIPDGVCACGACCCWLHACMHACMMRACVERAGIAHMCTARCRPTLRNSLVSSALLRPPSQNTHTLTTQTCSWRSTRMPAPGTCCTTKAARRCASRSPRWPTRRGAARWSCSDATSAVSGVRGALRVVSACAREGF
jgi:hypothetical protein